MSMVITKEEFFNKKIACLLHDPPNKAWLLVNKEDHEVMARKLAGELGLKEDPTDVARHADRFATSIDRWLLSLVVEKDYNKFPVDYIKIKNPFNPNSEKNIQETITENEVINYIKELKELLNSIKDHALYYHAFYALYEAYWIEKGYPTSCADTRVPTHTVFDHNYATASIMNWLIDSSEPQGLLLHIDLAGVQRYIESSRKLRDLWISSYLVSSITWYLCWTFVKTLGPDVLILPTCRHNPFYYHSLLVELKRNNLYNIFMKINEVSNSLINYDINKDIFPKHAIIPSSVTFILPKLEIIKNIFGFENVNDPQDLQKLIENKYKEVWHQIYNRVLNSLDLDLPSFNDKLKKSIKGVLEYSKTFGFDMIPPLPIRVIIVSTNEIKKRLEEEINRKLESEDNYRFYDKAFELLEEKMREFKSFRERPEEELKLFEMTSSIVQAYPKPSSRGYDYCSVCGYLPAVLIVPLEEEEYKKHIGEELLEALFSPGERLCPYCLVKRLLSVEKIFNHVFEEILGKVVEKDKEIDFPSVSDIACFPFKFSVINLAYNNRELHSSMIELFKKLVEDLSKLRIYQNYFVRIEEKALDIERTYLEKIKNLENKDLQEYLKFLLLLNSEIGIFRGLDETKVSELRKAWRNFVSELNKISKDIQSLTPYYVLLKFDCDNFGKIIRGDIRLGFKMSLEDYLTYALEGKSSELIKYILNNKIEEAEKLCRNEKILDADRRVKAVHDKIKEIYRKGRIFVSPSYHSSLSIALMRNAVRSSKIISEYNGVIIYAGGDDLLAVMPVYRCLEAIKDLRIKFNFPQEDRLMFEKINNYYIPSLGCASFSASIYITHHMFPLYVALRRLIELLEDYAKESMLYGVHLTIEPQNMEEEKELRKKDKLVFAYNPRGKEQFSVLPLSDLTSSFEKGSKPAIEIVSNLYKEIDEEIYSISLLYDFFNKENKDLILNLISINESEINYILLNNFIKKIIIRNLIKEEEKYKDKVDELTKLLVDNYKKYILNEEDKERRYITNEIISSVIIYRQGLKGI
jgi:CRISPR-associated protein Cmr2